MNASRYRLAITSGRVYFQISVHLKMISSNTAIADGQCSNGSATYCTAHGRRHISTCTLRQAREGITVWRHSQPYPTNYSYFLKLQYGQNYFSFCNSPSGRQQCSEGLRHFHSSLLRVLIHLLFYDLGQGRLRRASQGLIRAKDVTQPVPTFVPCWHFDVQSRLESLCGNRPCDS